MPDCCPTCGQPKLPLLRTLDLAQELTQRELQVTRLQSEGFTVREIAQHLHICYKTADVHLYNARKKLNVRNKAQMARALVRSEEQAHRTASDAEIQALATLVQHQTAILRAQERNVFVQVCPEFYALLAVLQSRGVIEKAMGANG